MYVCICICMYINIYIYIYIIYIYIYIYTYIHTYIYTNGNHKKISLIHSDSSWVVNLACLRQRFDDCLFPVSFYLYNFFYYLQYIFIKVHAYYTLQLSLEAS